MNLDLLLQNIAERHHNSLRRPEKGAVTYRVCATCGYCDWSSTAPNAPDAARAIPFDFDYGQPCPKCYEIAQRYPELYRWLGGVFSVDELARAIAVSVGDDAPITREPDEQNSSE